MSVSSFNRVLMRGIIVWLRDLVKVQTAAASKLVRFDEAHNLTSSANLAVFSIFPRIYKLAVFQIFCVPTNSQFSRCFRVSINSPFSQFFCVPTNSPFSKFFCVSANSQFSRFFRVPTNSRLGCATCRSKLPLINRVKWNGSALECSPSTRAERVRFPSNASCLVVLVKSHFDRHFKRKINTMPLAQ